MISIKIVAGDLDRLLQNALLYSDPDAMRLQEVLFVFDGDSLTVYACDDYVAITDSAPLIEGRVLEQSFTISDIKKLAEWVKADKKIIHKYEIELRQKFTGMIFECDDTSTEDESDNIFLSDVTVNDAWDVVFRLLDEEQELAQITGFTIKPERVSKLWRLKADKDAPIDFRGVLINSQLLVQFKKGDTIIGAIMPVKREYVSEEFLWPNTEA